MSRLRLPTLALAVLLAGCDSQIHMTATPANPPITVSAGIPATFNTTTNTVTINNPGLLPASVQAASDLKVGLGGTKVQVTRAPGGYYTFAIPPGTKFQQDANGNITVTFIMNDQASQIITLQTGSPVPFGSPAILTDPSPAYITQGLDVNLTANTDADPNRYQFTWSYGASAQGPWQAIPDQGKAVKWTPAAAGNYFIKLDTIDRQTQQDYSTITPTAIVFVTDARNVITTTPGSGSVSLGSTVGLKFNPPAQLASGSLTYAWSTSASPTGPWTTLNGAGPQVSWLPTTVGSDYVRVDVTNQATGDVNTFVSPQAIVFVSQGAPVVTPSTSAANRGDKVTLTLNIPSPGTGPFTWYYQVTGAVPSWTLIPGNGTSVDLLVNQSGSYNFRVDLPQNGTIKSLTTSEPVLTVTEQTPLIQSSPPDEVIKPGSSASLQLNAAGVTPGDYNLTWGYSLSPTGPFTTIAPNSTSDLTSKTFVWNTSASNAAGAYYIQVIATQRAGNHNSYTFTSSAPVVTLQP
ncbi:MAG TPA: hypothetical protein V6D47_08380 [Oscillatoriaceae cyanobacterium]